MVAWLIIIGIIILGIILLLITLAVIYKIKDAKKNESDVLEYIINNPNKASFYFSMNNNSIISYHSDEKMPLASVLKIMITVDFLKQIHSGTINPMEQIDLDYLERYYIPGSDGGAHKEWIRLEGLDSRDNCRSVTLFEIAEGMMRYSSNANTEYLMVRLGLDSINRTMKELCGEEHSLIYPVSSVGLAGTYLMEKEKLTLNQARQRLTSMDDNQYRDLAKSLWLLLGSSKEQTLINKYNRKPSYDRALQLIWSERMPLATTHLYATLLDKLQSQVWFTHEMKTQFELLMKRKIRDGSPFELILSKGGSSISILNDVLYARDKEGNSLSFALFIHDPEGRELIWLRKKVDLFIRRIFTEPSYRAMVAHQLNSK